MQLTISPNLYTTIMKLHTRKLDFNRYLNIN
jgi:hypothetical protein